MEHFARWIVKRRKLILVLAVLLLIPSVFGALGTYINYDILPAEKSGFHDRRDVFGG